jgi:hypothetical protein
MNFIYQQLDVQGTTAADDLRLLVNGFTVDLDSDVTVDPTGALVSGTEVEIDTVDTFWIGQFEAIAFDAGDATTSGQPAVPTATAGRVIVFFITQGNSKLDETVAGSFGEARLAAWENGTTVIVSTDPSVATNDLYQVEQTNGGVLPALLGGMAVPVSESANSTNSVATTLHIYWTENVSRDGPGPGPSGSGGDPAHRLGARSYALTDTAATTAVPLADRFTPPTTDDPNFIDNPTNGILFGDNYSMSDPQMYFLRDGSTAGILFDEDQRIWYQQTTSDADGYYEDAGIFQPEIVDHDSERSIERRWIVRPNPECDNLSSTVIYWEKRVPDAGYARGYVRLMD